MDVNLNLEKARIRKKILSVRNKLSRSLVENKSNIIFHKIRNLAEINKSNYFLIYSAINNEVDTKPIIDFLKNKNKRVLLPKYLDEKWAIFEFKNWQTVELGPFGILQPKDNKSFDKNENDVAIIPGLAFDNNGARLGFGKGVYDNLLNNFKGIKIGLAYDFQIIDLIPTEKHDLKMDLIISDKRVYNFKIT